MAARGAALVIIAMVALLALDAAADPIVIKAGVSAEDAEKAGYGVLQQKDLPVCATLTPEIGCGPAAAVNSFVYLQKIAPEIYKKELVPELPRDDDKNDKNRDGKVDAYDDMIQAATILSGNDYMKTRPPTDKDTGGTFRDDFYDGKRSYIEKKVAGKTTYAVMDDPKLDEFDPLGKFEGDRPGLVRKPPSWEFLLKALRNHQDIEILITRDNGKMLTYGHYVTVVGMEFTDTDGDGAFDQGEPAKLHYMGTFGLGRTRELMQRADGRLFIKLDEGETDIRFAVEESPILAAVPAPSGLASLLPALIAAAAMGRRRNRAD